MWLEIRVTGVGNIDLGQLTGDQGLTIPAEFLSIRYFTYYIILSILPASIIAKVKYRTTGTITNLPAEQQGLARTA